MENTTEIKVQTPEEKAEEVMAEVLRMEEKRLSLVDGEELVSAYDFPADSVEGEKSHQIFLTTKRFVHVQKTTTKRREAKKVSAFLISEIDCIDSVIAHRRHINWILVVLSALFAIAGVIVGVAVTWYSYIGAGVFLFQIPYDGSCHTVKSPVSAEQEHIRILLNQLLYRFG